MHVARIAAGLAIASLFAGSADLMGADEASKEADAKCATLEDFYGDTGTQFRAALRFSTPELDATTLDGTIGFGVAVDDMVIAWKESPSRKPSGEKLGAGGGCDADIAADADACP